MSNLVALYHIQQLELDIIASSKRIRAIEQQLEDDEAVRAAEANLAAAQEQYDDAAKRARVLEQDIASLQERRATSEERMYSGSIKNPKELQDLKMEQESLSRRSGVLADELGRINEEREAWQQTVAVCEQDLRAAHDNHSEGSYELRTERDRLKAEVAEQMVQRQRDIQQIPKELYRDYQQMRKRQANRPVARLQGAACSACGIEQHSTVVTAVETSTQYLNCQSCGRILVAV